MKIDELCEILKAHCEGKTIQTLCADGKYRDEDIKEYPINTFLRNAFRVKPEPREIWVIQESSGFLYEDRLFTSEVEVHKHTPYGAKAVKFREVLDE